MPNTVEIVKSCLKIKGHCIIWYCLLIWKIWHLEYSCSLDSIYSWSLFKKIPCPCVNSEAWLFLTIHPSILNIVHSCHWHWDCKDCLSLFCNFWEIYLNVFWKFLDSLRMRYLKVHSKKEQHVLFLVNITRQSNKDCWMNDLLRFIPIHIM